MPLFNSFLDSDKHIRENSNEFWISELSIVYQAQKYTYTHTHPPQV